MKNTRIFYKDVAEVYGSLTPEDCQRLLMAHLNYEVGEPIENYFEKGDPLAATFIQIKRMIDINEKKYQERCDKNRENAKKRWNKPVEESKEVEMSTYTKEEEKPAYKPENSQELADSIVAPNITFEKVQNTIKDKEEDITNIVKTYMLRDKYGDVYEEEANRKVQELAKEDGYNQEEFTELILYINYLVQKASAVF